MDNCYMKLGAVKAKEIDGELYISCWNFSKALGEKEREISDLCKEIDNLKKQISELESELSVKEDLLEIKNALCEEEPLPFSAEQYEEKIDKIEKVVLGIQAYLKKGTEQKIKELEEEQEKLRLEADYYRFWQETISPLKPKSEVHKVKGL